MNPLNPFFSLLVSRGVDPKEYASKFSTLRPEIIDEGAIGSKDFQVLLQIRDALAEQSPSIDKYFIFNASDPTKVKHEVAPKEIEEDDDGTEWAIADDDGEDLAQSAKVATEEEEVDELEWVEAEDDDEHTVAVKGTVADEAHAKSDEGIKRTIQRLKNDALTKLQNLERASTEGYSHQNSVLIEHIQHDVLSIVNELLEYTRGMAAHEDVISMKISMEHYFEKVLRSRNLDEGIKPIVSDADSASEKDVLPVVKNGLGQSIQPKKKFWDILDVTSSVAKKAFDGVQGLFAAARAKAGEAYESLIGRKEYGPVNQKEALQQNIQLMANQVASSLAANARQKYFSMLPNILANGLQKLIEFVLSTKQFLPYLLSNVVNSAHANLIADPERAKEIVDRLINNQIAILGDELKTVHEITQSVEATHPDIPKSLLEGVYLRALRDAGKLIPGLEPSLTPKELELRELELSGAPIPAADLQAAEVVRLKYQAQEHLYFREMAQSLYDQLFLPNGLSPQLEFFQKLTKMDFKELSIEQIAVLIEKQVNYYAEFKNICPLITKMLRQISASVKRSDAVTEFSQEISRFLADVELLPEKIKREEAVDVRSIGLKFEDVAVDESLNFQPQADVDQLILSVSHIVLKGAPRTLFAGVRAVSSSILQKVQSTPTVQKVVSFAAERRYDRAIVEKIGSIASPLIQQVRGSRAFQGMTDFFKSKFETYRIAEKSEAAFQRVVKGASVVTDFAQAKAEKGLAKKIKAKVMPSIQRARNQMLDQLHHSGNRLFEEKLNWMAEIIDVTLRPKIGIQPAVPVQELSEEEMKEELNTAIFETLTKFGVISNDENPEFISQFMENVAQFAANNILNQLGSKTLNKHLILSFLDGFLGAFSKTSKNTLSSI